MKYIFLTLVVITIFSNNMYSNEYVEQYETQEIPVYRYEKQWDSFWKDLSKDALKTTLSALLCGILVHYIESNNHLNEFLEKAGYAVAGISAISTLLHFFALMYKLGEGLEVIVKAIVPKSNNQI